jgi:hypothetical protein
MAGSKNNPTNKGTSQRSVLVTSDVCEKCTTQCAKGIKYINSLKLGKSGNGCVCHLLK